MIKPCPFCGNKEIESEYAESDECSTYFWIECTRCEIVMDRGTKSEAIKAWNTRSSDKPQDNKGE